MSLFPKKKRSPRARARSAVKTIRTLPTAGWPAVSAAVRKAARTALKKAGKASGNGLGGKKSKINLISKVGRIGRFGKMVAALTVAAALLLGATACNTRTATTTTPAATTTAAASVVQTTAPATTRASSAATASTTKPATTTKATTSPTTTILLTEPQLAYVVSVSTSSPVTVSVDYVEMYYGAEAVAKAKQDKSPIVEKDDKGNEFIPNDYYLRNTNAQLRTFPLAAKCVIKALPSDGGSDATRTLTAAQLRTLVGSRKRLMEITFNPAGTEIVALTEFYLP